jgi:hypothetical protein
MPQSKCHCQNQFARKFHRKCLFQKAQLNMHSPRLNGCHFPVYNKRYVSTVRPCFWRVKTFSFGPPRQGRFYVATFGKDVTPLFLCCRARKFHLAAFGTWNDHPVWCWCPPPGMARPRSPASPQQAIHCPPLCIRSNAASMLCQW